MSWRDKAACITADPNLFTEPTREDTAVSRWTRYNAARAICADCPVMDRCLTEGVTNMESGVWGGQLLECGALNRHGMRPPARQLQPHGTRAAYVRHSRRKEPQCIECHNWRRDLERAQRVKRALG